MAERIVDAAFSDGVGTATFFLTDHYVVYDFNADRVVDALHPVTSFPPGAASGLPSGFAPSGPEQRIDAALLGRRPSAGSAFLFRDGDYVRFDLGPGTFTEVRTVPDGWGLPAGFTTPVAAWNGFLNRDPYCYFFQDTRYARLLWDANTTDAGYPKPISNMVGIPAPFAAAEPDACVDGAGPFANTSYLFQGDQYLRFRWVDAGEPHGDGSARIQDGWTGLAEMLLAAKALSNSLVWLAETRDLLAALDAGTLAADQASLVEVALETHFHTTVADTASIATIRTQYDALVAVLTTPETFRFRTDDESVNLDHNPAGDPPAAYVDPNDTHVNISRTFAARPELNRISVMLHEAIHVVDPASGTPDVHISEWYVTDAEADRLGLGHTADFDPTVFATRYDLITTAQSLHNPSAYATFARHLHFGVDSRETL